MLHQRSQLRITRHENHISKVSLSLPGETNGAIRASNTRSIDDVYSFVTMKAHQTRRKGQRIFIHFLSLFSQRIGINSE